MLLSCSPITAELLPSYESVFVSHRALQETSARTSGHFCSQALLWSFLLSGTWNLASAVGLRPLPSTRLIACGVLSEGAKRSAVLKGTG